MFIELAECTDCHENCSVPASTGIEFRQDEETLTLIYKQYMLFGSEIYQSGLGSKSCNNSLQHPANYTEQHSMNHHWLYTNYTNKSSTLWNTGTHTTRPYKHARDTISSHSQCKPRPPVSLHYMPTHQPTPHSIKTTPQALYTRFLNIIPEHSNSQIHAHLAT